MQAYENIRPIKIKITKLFQNTVLLNWWYQNRSMVLNSQHSIAHLSDILRLVLLWKYGGFYSDLDTITIKSVKDLLHYPGMGYMYEFYHRQVLVAFFSFDLKQQKQFQFNFIFFYF